MIKYTLFYICINVKSSFLEFNIPNRYIFLSTLVKGKYSIKIIIILYSSWKSHLRSQDQESTQSRHKTLDQSQDPIFISPSIPSLDLIYSYLCNYAFFFPVMFNPSLSLFQQLILSQKKVKVGRGGAEEQGRSWGAGKEGRINGTGCPPGLLLKRQLSTVSISNLPENVPSTSTSPLLAAGQGGPLSTVEQTSLSLEAHSTLFHSAFPQPLRNALLH